MTKRAARAHLAAALLGTRKAPEPMPASRFMPRCGRAEKVGRLGTPLFEVRGLGFPNQWRRNIHGGQRRCETSTCWVLSMGASAI
jgi:hypothetical protein